MASVTGNAKNPCGSFLKKCARFNCEGIILLYNLMCISEYQDSFTSLAMKNLSCQVNFFRKKSESILTSAAALKSVPAAVDVGSIHFLHWKHIQM